MIERDITDYSLDDIKIYPKTYLLILALKENFSKSCLTFFTKNIIKENTNKKHIIMKIKNYLLVII